jgi:KEOPS complex subunit Cgi121
MKEDPQPGEIHAARCTIRDRQAFLAHLQDIGREFSTCIICFNADMMAGRYHAITAVRLARRSWEAGCAIANTLEMEALLYAAGSRQCNVALRFGIHDGENHLYVLCDPEGNTGMWDALSALIEYCDPEIYETVDQKKKERLIDLFGITTMELETLDVSATLADLVLERVALLQVLR